METRSGLAGPALVAAVMAVATACVDELGVGPLVDPDIAVEITLFDSDGDSLPQDLMMVGQTTEARLSVFVDGRRRTGLRVRWRSTDPTALDVRSRTDAVALGQNTLIDSLDATLFGEVTALRRGAHSFEVQLDSVGVEGVTVVPVSLLVEDRWGTVSAGDDHTCAATLLNAPDDPRPDSLPELRRGGEAFCWGNGGFGALGTGESEIELEPEPVESAVGFEVVRAGTGFTCGQDALRLLWCWGDNFNGQLGIGNRLDQFVPRLTALAEGFSDFDVGETFTCATQTAAPTLCWGSNDEGQLGCGDQPGCDATRMLEPNTAELVNVRATDFRRISTGGSHACGVDFAGSAWCWGSNANGQLGVFFPDSALTRDAWQVDTDQRFSEVAAGYDFSCGVLLDGSSVSCWGGDLGGGPDDATPAEVGFPPGNWTYSGLSAGGSATARHACVVRNEDRVAFCWGSDDEGQLGDGVLGPTRRDAQAVVLPGAEFVEITAGGRHTCGIVEAEFDLPFDDLPDSGEIYCWGSNAFGVLGIDDPSSDPSPLPLLIADLF